MNRLAGANLKIEDNHRLIDPATDTVTIPEFTMLRRIGGGSYGEVWLARSVTGAHRAVKIVRREDFDLERTFEREFSGIQRYENVSQGHAGLVDVLHVGRHDAEGFYYYVMELADDVHGYEEGGEFDAEHYVPRTLAADLKKLGTVELGSCIDSGRRLAGALGHLHRNGLTHRDVKPANIIFVRGKPQMADIGLVATSGQRSYVGTEGYVPPEGPGTAVADLGLAINENFKNKAGETVEQTCFVDVVVWGRQAETSAEYLHKGSPVFVEGRLQLDQWENQQGEKRSKLRVRADRVQFLGAPSKSTEFAAGPATESAPPPPPAEEDDVPF